MHGCQVVFLFFLCGALSMLGVGLGHLTGYACINVPDWVTHNQTSFENKTLASLYEAKRDTEDFTEKKMASWLKMKNASLNFEIVDVSKYFNSSCGSDVISGDVDTEDVAISLSFFGSLLFLLLMMKLWCVLSRRRRRFVKRCVHNHPRLQWREWFKCPFPVCYLYICGYPPFCCCCYPCGKKSARPSKYRFNLNVVPEYDMVFFRQRHDPPCGAMCCRQNACCMGHTTFKTEPHLIPAGTFEGWDGKTMDPDLKERWRMIMEAAHDDGWLHFQWVSENITKKKQISEREILERMWANLSPDHDDSPCIRLTDPMDLFGTNNDVEISRSEALEKTPDHTIKIKQVYTMPRPKYPCFYDCVCCCFTYHTKCYDCAEGTNNVRCPPCCPCGGPDDVAKAKRKVELIDEYSRLTRDEDDTSRSSSKPEAMLLSDDKAATRAIV
jgi:hypothetical protein